MTTNPKAKKVQFKVIEEDSVEDDLIPQKQIFEDTSHTELYVIAFYTTNDPIDNKESYSFYLHESRLGFDSYHSRYVDVLDFAQKQLDEGIITGYRMKGYRLSPFGSQQCVIIDSKNAFKPKEKTFLNGPLKSNEFLAKKGKHYA